MRRNKHERLKGVQLSFGVNRTRFGDAAAQVALLVNRAEGDGAGLQLSMMVNRAGRDLDGVQVSLSNFVGAADEITPGSTTSKTTTVAYTVVSDQGALGRATAKLVLTPGQTNGIQVGAVNASQNLAGIQVGALNGVGTRDFESSGLLEGAQVGGWNSAERVDGAQIGVVNTASTVNGLQLGVVNTTRNLTGVQIGLVNYARNNALPFIRGLVTGICGGASAHVQWNLKSANVLSARPCAALSCWHGQMQWNLKTATAGAPRGLVDLMRSRKHALRSANVSPKGPNLVRSSR